MSHEKLAVIAYKAIRKHLIRWIKDGENTAKPPKNYQKAPNTMDFDVGNSAKNTQNNNNFETDLQVNQMREKQDSK